MDDHPTPRGIFMEDRQTLDRFDYLFASWKSVGPMGR